MWDDPNPVFIDFETQSFVDIKESGGRIYAEHESTRVLILSVCYDNRFIVWIPDHIKADTSLLTAGRLWPHYLKPEQPCELLRGATCPAVIRELANNHAIVAHNAYGFDYHIWKKHVDPDTRLEQWLDSMFVSKSAGRPGRLDTLGKAILGQGKDQAAKLMPLLCTVKQSPFGGYSYPIIRPGDLKAFTTYAIADVEILRKLWYEFDYVNVEADVIRTNNQINERGVHVDRPLLRTLEHLSAYSVDQAIHEIEHLTKGRLHSGNIRSTRQVHEWLDGWGIYITDDSGKPCLRKDVIQRYIDSPYLIESNLNSATEIPPIVIQVLSLRMKALRITDAKVKRALQRIGSGGRIRDLHVYHQAHTGRWSSWGVQVHNLPRPLKGLDTEVLLNKITPLLECGDTRKVYNEILNVIPIDKDRGIRIGTVDDVCAALIRPAFKAPDGQTFVICDYSTVEARGAAWVANERKMLKAFKDGRDLYKEFAMQMFGRESVDEVTKDERQIAKSAILGAQYGLGPDKFRIYAASMGADLNKAGVTAEYCIDTYRDTYPAICGFRPNSGQNFRTGGIWHELDKAVKEVVHNKNVVHCGRCVWYYEHKSLCCRLPSGRVIYYPEARIEDVIPPYCYKLGLPLNPKATVVYTSTYGAKSLYGGLLLENIVQAICRDLLAYAMVKMDQEGIRTVLSVHDEVVNEVDEFDSIKCLRRTVEIMSTTPTWADGFPLECEGFVSPRFVKSPFKGSPHLSTKELTNVH